MQIRRRSYGQNSSNSLLNRVRRGPDLIRAAQGRDRTTIAIYLARNFLNQAMNMPASSQELDLTLHPGIRVAVQTYSSQLGAYLDVFHERVYGQLPDFVGQPGWVIVDAGAHVGFYTLWQAPLVGPTGRIYALEPNPPIYSLLQQNVRQNGYDCVHCIPKALAATEARLTMRAPARGSSSTRILESASPDGVPTIEVESITLDALVEEYQLDHIDVLKMDTEGAEFDIVRGGARRALAITKRIVMESHKVDRTDPGAGRTREKVRDFLLPLGFRLTMDHARQKIVYFER